MLVKKLLEVMNEQINKEFYSEYLYLAMAAHFSTEKFGGFASWFYAQAKEEHAHAMKLMSYIIERGGHVEFKNIDVPKFDAKDIVHVFEQVLAHEKSISKSIEDVMKVAEKEKDFSAMNFLQWYVDEQIEEENNVEKVLHMFKIIGKEGVALIMMDKELGSRQG